MSALPGPAAAIRPRGGGALVPLAAGAVWVLLCFGSLALPQVALSGRDIPLFHLPLLSALRQLAGGGGGVGWNPWLQGGQPVLSNPSYAAFYPLTWAVLPLSPLYALNLLVLAHAAIGFAGAWQLARQLGGGRGAAALAAVGYSGCGAMLSLVSAFGMFCSMAWFPWVLRWGDEALRAAAGQRPRRLAPAALLTGAALALQMLVGVPETVAMSGLALAALALSEGRRAPAAAARLAVAAAAALGLAAVQILPALRRVMDSPRAHGLPFAEATAWSAPPQRFVELLLPHFFGNPGRILERLFFGWGVHDRGYPYVLSLYPGLLLAVLGTAALLGGALPRRAAWATLAGAGAFLGCGRHNPLYAPLLAVAPLLAKLRYPEKFAILVSFALTFAGALGWQRLMRERAAGNLRAANLPLALALLVLAAALSLTAALYVQPALGLDFVRAHAEPPVPAGLPQRGLALLRAEGVAAVAVAAGVAGLLALCRSRLASARQLTALAVTLLAADLLHYGRGLIFTVPAAEYRHPPPLARALAAAPGRVYAPPLAGGRSLMPLGDQEPRVALLRLQLARLEPYGGLLWGVRYALHEDYDRMLTAWGQRARQTLEAAAPQPRLAQRYLGAWSVAAILRLKSDDEWSADLARDPRSPPVEPLANPFYLPRFRFAPRARFHASWAAALAAARAGGFDLGAHEHCWRPGAPPAEVPYPGPARVLALDDRGSRIEVRYRAASPSFLVVADTFDAGWRATLDDAAPSRRALPVALYPTAACQLGMELPAGEHRLVLRYHDAMVDAGVVISLATALACIAALAWTAAAGKRCLSS